MVGESVAAGLAIRGCVPGALPTPAGFTSLGRLVPSTVAAQGALGGLETFVIGTTGEGAYWGLEGRDPLQGSLQDQDPKWCRAWTPRGLASHC